MEKLIISCSVENSSFLFMLANSIAGSARYGRLSMGKFGFRCFLNVATIKAMSNIMAITELCNPNG